MPAAYTKLVLWGHTEQNALNTVRPSPFEAAASSKAPSTRKGPPQGRGLRPTAPRPKALWTALSQTGPFWLHRLKPK